MYDLAGDRCSQSTCCVRLFTAWHCPPIVNRSPIVIVTVERLDVEQLGLT